MTDLSTRRGRPVARALDILRDGTGLLAGLAVLILMFHIVADTVMRAFFGSPLSGTLEYVMYWWMVTIAFGAWGLAESRGDHIEATALYELMPRRIQRVWRGTSRVVTIVALSMLAFYGFLAARQQQAYGEYAGGSSIPIWPMRYWVFVGALVFAIELIRGFRQPTEDDAAETAEFV